MNRHLHWFRNDLRLYDNPALYAASQQQTEGLLCCFFICAEQWRAHDMAPIQAEFLRAHLRTLSADLAARNIPLLVDVCPRFAEVPQRLEQLMRNHDCDTLHFNEEYPLNERRRDRTVLEHLQAAGFQVRRYHDQCVVPPGQLKTQAGKPYTVFTPFRRAWQAEVDKAWPSPWPAPASQTALLCPPSPIPDQISGFAPLSLDATWPVGETAAQERLEAFAEEGLLHYQERRDFPQLDDTSRLSPYLALGILSPRQAIERARAARREHPARSADIDCWISELVWREFYLHILRAFPQVCRHQPFKEDTQAVPWRYDEDDFARWCQGRTGIPIVDAAMRQLNQTGWMHNRLRMITAMFLSKNLLIDWRWGERYFMQHLIDGHLGSNNGGWQWSASTGTDAAPYFRVFNPVTQAQKFDPEGEFIRRYVPELRQRPTRNIHQPLTDEEAAQGLYDYPAAMVDLKASRERVLDAFKQAKAAPRTDDAVD